MTSVGIQAIFTPAGNTTRTGRVKDLVSRPLPSSPWPPRPRAHRLPSVSSAYSAAFELPTWATVPSRVMAARAEDAMSTHAGERPPGPAIEHIRREALRFAEVAARLGAKVTLVSTV